MIYVTGGYAQGKAEYVKNEYEVDDECFYEGSLDDMEAFDKKVVNKKLVIKDLNGIAYKYFMDKKDIMPLLNRIISDYPDCIIISTEIGNGIVPVDKSLREYREWMGRLQIYIASKAEHVVRVICGIGQVLK